MDSGALTGSETDKAIYNADSTISIFAHLCVTHYLLEGNRPQRTGRGTYGCDVSEIKGESTTRSTR